MAAAERNNEEWQRLLIGKTLLEDDTETTLEASQVKARAILSYLRFSKY